MKYCDKCGNSIADESMFCNKCGKKYEDININGENSTVQISEFESEKKSSKLKVLCIVESIIIVLLIGMIIFLCVNGKGLSGSNSSKKVHSYSGTVLNGGNYTVGVDFEAGTYDIKYQTTMSSDRFFLGDYFYITHENSEGSHETLGGTKFDDRFGGFNYEKATAGETTHVTLEPGDKLNIEANSGTWTY